MRRRSSGFIGSALFENDRLTEHELWSEDERERPSPRPSPAGGRGRRRSPGFEGLGLGLAGMEGDALCGEVWPSRRGSYATPSPLGEGWGEGLAERFVESGVGEGAMLTDHEPGRIPGGETPPSTAGGTPAATDARFMESPLFELDLLTDLEPGRAGTPVSSWRASRLP